MNARFFLSFVLVALTACSSQAGIIHDNVPDANYIAHGNLFPSVGYLNQGFASGVLIDENWVLTAAHNTIVAIEQDLTLTFATGSNLVSDPGISIDADLIVQHPDFNAIGNGPDLALLRLSSSVTDIVPVTLFDGDLSINDRIDLVGFGRPGSPSTGIGASDGQRRGWQGGIAEFGNSIVLSAFISDDYFATEFLRFTGTPLEGAASPADSGGGMFLNGELAGILSFQSGIPNYGALSAGTMIAPNIAWIEETIAANSIPEPSSALLILFAGGMSTLYNRRR